MADTKLNQYEPAIQLGFDLPLANIDTTGASANQVVKFDGTNVVWGDETVSPGEIGLTNAYILVGNASNVAAGVALSGDATIANTGALTIANAAVTKAKLATGVSAAFMAMFLDDSYTTVGGAAAEAIAIPGVLGTDKAIVSLYDSGTNTVEIVSAVCSADTLTVTFSADPGNDAIIAYVIYRATS